MTVKEIQYAEETIYGVTPANATFKTLGYEPKVMFSFDPREITIPQPDSEDRQTIQRGDASDITWDVVYKPTDTSFAKYGVNSQGGGSGTIDKSLTLLMTVKLSATTETWIILRGARSNVTSLKGRAGGDLEVRVTGRSQTMPIPVQADPGYNYATSSTSIPIQLKDGGITPVTIAGTSYNVNDIEVVINRNLATIPQPDSTAPQNLLPQQRDVDGTFGMTWETLTPLTQFDNLIPTTLIWTLKNSTNTTLTIGTTILNRLNSITFLPEETLFENYSFEGTTAVLT